MSYLGQWYFDIAAERNIGDPLPFVEVCRITGGDDMISDHPIISIHSFNVDYTSTKDLSLEVHEHMKDLTPKTEVLVNGVAYNVDYRCVEESPHKVDYDDTTLRRFVARYGLGLRLK